MKQILLSLILSTILFSACTKKESQRPSVIYISGTVSDKTNSSPLDSVSIILSEDRGGVISSVLIPLKTYSTNSSGEFSFNYSQNKERYSYELEFSKDLYTVEKVHLDKDIEKQHFNIQLIK